MSPELLSRHEPRGPAGPAGVPDPAGPGGQPFSARLATKRPSGRRHRSRPALIMAGVATVALLSGAGLANAASATGGPVNAARAVGPAGAARILSPSDSHVGAGPWNGMAGSGPSGRIMPVHGQIVLAKPGGGFRTVDFQNGTVTKVDSTSITLKSADGFSQSYPITSSTIVSAGATVSARSRAATAQS